MLDRGQCLRNQRGAETLEWILIAGLITGVGIALFPGVLGPALSTTIGVIAGAILGTTP